MDVERCPRCRSWSMVPIVYGYPDPSLADAAGRGEVALGGCVIREDDPTVACRACGAPFGRPSDGARP